MDEPVPFVPTEKAELYACRLRVLELEHICRFFDRTTRDLYHYVRAVDGIPDDDQWQLIREQIDEMVDPYGPRNPNR